jgi:glycoprotein-N-acetylgalactosamine 3-beta-galactosyltransferase
MKSFEYVYKNHFHDADWFIKTDDDTYVIMENLRHMLSTENASEPVFFGHHLIRFNESYVSGGAGYVFSKEALRRIAERSEDKCVMVEGNEDRQMSRCLVSLGARLADSRDRYGRSRFHCFIPQYIADGYGLPLWYPKMDYYGAKTVILFIFLFKCHNVVSKRLYCKCIYMK